MDNLRIIKGRGSIERFTYNKRGKMSIPLIPSFYNFKWVKFLLFRLKPGFRRI